LTAPIRIAIVGLGVMGKNHARLLAEIEGAELVAVCDPAEEAMDWAKSRDLKGYRTYQELFEREKLDAVTVAVPTRFHLEVGLAALELGLHVLMEKPIAVDLNEARQLVAAATKHNAVFAVGHVERFNPAVRELKRRLDAGEVGRIFQVHSRRQGPFPSRVRDVGAVIDLATHDLDVMRYLLGVEVVRLYAETERRIHTEHEDMLNALLRFENGAVGVVQVNWLTPTKIRELIVLGERGMLQLNYLTQDLVFYENLSASAEPGQSLLTGVSEGTLVEHKVDRAEPLRVELESFLASVAGKTRPEVGGEDGLRALSLALDLVRSGNDGRVVDVANDDRAREAATAAQRVDGDRAPDRGSAAAHTIWVVNHYADPPDGLATRSFDLARRWVEKGHPTTIFVSNFGHYHLRPVRRIPFPRLWLDEDIEGVRMVWLRSPGYSRNNWRRVLNMLTFSALAIIAGTFRRHGPDVVIGVSVHPLAALSGWLLARMRGARFFFEVTDLWPQTLIEFGMLSPGSLAARWMRRLERFLFRHSERIIMLWRHTEEYVESQGVSRERIVWIPHGVELSRYDDLGLYDGVASTPFRVMFLGGFVSANSLETILDAASVLQKRERTDIQLLLIGSGQDRDAIINRAKALGLDNVEFPAAVPKAEISKAMARADAFIYGLRDLPLYRYGISLNKLTDYLASGRPIIFFGHSTYDPVAEARAGFSVPPGDPVAIADALERLAALSPAERKAMGDRGRDYLLGYHNIANLAERFLGVLETAPK
jgi:predicted dehydrogenase/glycosyltransferase involved in cell wall biosynthesis